MKVVEHDSGEELQRLFQRERDGRLAKRLWIVWQARLGLTEPQITVGIGMSRRQVQEWVRRYNIEGLAGLRDRPGRGRKPILSLEEKRQVAARVEDGPCEGDVCSLRGLDLQTFIKRQFGKQMSLATVYMLLHKLGYSWLVPRPKHRKGDPEAAEEFKGKQVPDELAKARAAHPKKEIVVFFQDECRFGQQGTLTRLWAKRGTRPTAVRQTEYEYLWVIGAASPQTGQAEAILSPVLNTGIINQFLSQFSASLAPEVHAVMIWDGAGFHRAHDLVVPDNVTLLPLPPYSPELNGMENLWHYLRSHCWSNRVFKNYDALFETAENDWRKYCLQPDLIKSVCGKCYLRPRD